MSVTIPKSSASLSSSGLLPTTLTSKLFWLVHLPPDSYLLPSKISQLSPLIVIFCLQRDSHGSFKFPSINPSFYPRSSAVGWFHCTLTYENKLHYLLEVDPNSSHLPQYSLLPSLPPLTWSLLFLSLHL